MLEKLLLANYVHLSMSNKNLILSAGMYRRKVSNEKLIEVVIQACLLWSSPETTSSIAKKLEVKFGNGFKGAISIAIGLLESGPFLIADEIYNPEDRYSRHSLYFNLSKGNPIEIQERLHNSKVAIIGCGGIGNFISVPLATAGVGHLVLVDFDTIEESNLTRQIMFTEKEVGRSKINTLENKIKERNSNTSVTKINSRINTYEDLLKLPSDIDLIVLSADGSTDELESVVFLVNKFCVEKNIPFINVGYIEDIAVWGPFVVPHKTACQNCERENILGFGKKNKYSAVLDKINEKYQSPSCSPVNSLASAAALTDILKHLGKYGQVSSYGKRMAIRTDTFEKIEMDFQISKDCYCQKNQAS